MSGLKRRPLHQAELQNSFLSFHQLGPAFLLHNAFVPWVCKSLISVHLTLRIPISRLSRFCSSHLTHLTYFGCTLRSIPRQLLCFARKLFSAALHSVFLYTSPFCSHFRWCSSKSRVKSRQTSTMLLLAVSSAVMDGNCLTCTEFQPSKVVSGWL